MQHKQILLFAVLGIVLATLGLAALMLATTLISAIVAEKMALLPKNPSFPMWRDMEIPIYQKFYLYNVTNPKEVEQHNAKPHLQEVGPFVYRLNISKSELNFSSDTSELTFFETKQFHFVRGLSPFDLDTSVTTLNVPLASLYSLIQDMNPASRKLIEILIKLTQQTLFIDATAEELLFKGKWNLIACVAGLFNPKVKNCTFSYFGEFNNTNDGQFTVNTGVEEIARINSIISLNGSDKLDFWQDDTCNSIYGASNGELFAPVSTLPPSKQFQFFRTDFCRVFNLTLKQTGIESDLGYLPVDRFVPSPDTFLNATLNPRNACYRPKATKAQKVSSSSIDSLFSLLAKHGIDLHRLESLFSLTDFSVSARKYRERPSGVFDVSACQGGAPIVISYPHFYTADPYYLAAVTGLSPNRSKHHSYIDVEPVTGTPVDFLARIQINVDIQRDPNSPLLLPTLWQEFSIHITEQIANTIKSQTQTPTIGLYSISTLILVLGIIFILYSCTLIFIESRQNQESHIDDTNQLIRDENEDTNNNSILHEPNQS